jgi:hypothetical protein
MAYEQIPCGDERGIFSAEQGMVPKEQGSDANEQRIARSRNAASALAANEIL